jgi:glycosyltransferase involved in cell wall biosynthesis
VPYLSDSVELCRRETGAVIAPTAVGHCMYIRREVLDEFGAFDSVFGKGYGEENDLSQRIRAKYDNVIDPGCYVWHKGSASFAAAEKRALNDKNLQIVHQRYPHYPFEVFAFQSSDPLRPVRKRMLRATRDPRRRVLNICHSYGVAAGTEKHVRDLALGLSDTTLSFIAAPDGHGREGLHLYQGETHLGTHPYLQVPWPIAPSTMPLMESTWTDVIDEVRPDIIHLHHLLKHPLGLIERLVTSDIPVVVSVHDHFFLCPDYTLLGCPGTDRCQDCFVKKFGAGHADYQIYRRRIFDGALRKAAAVITPSEDTSRRLREVYPGLKITVIPHGIRAAAHAGSANKVQKCSENGTQVPLRFGYIGNLTHQKGLNTLLAAFSSAVRRAPCELHLWGHANNLYKNACNKPYMYYHGAYSTEELPSITEKFDVGIVPSIFPETFCYTLSELSSAGLPCLVADIGSLGERVRHGLNGWKVVPGDVAAWEDALVGVAKNPQLLMSLDHRPAVRSIGEMCRDYDHLYAALCSIKSPFTILT